MERMKMNRVVALVASAFTLILPAAAEDPYIESLGTSGISTGYRMKGGISRVEVDYQLTTTASSAGWRIFGDTTAETTFGTMFYFTGSSGVGGAHTFRVRGKPNFSAAANDSTKTGDSQWSTGEFAKANMNRYTLVTDLKNGKNQIVSGSATYTGTFNVSLFTGLVADLPLSLFAAYGSDGTNATTFASKAKARIYGVKIYENYAEGGENAPIHNFVPCLKDGETPCFKDLVGGGFIIGENVAAFTASDNAPTYQDDGYLSTVSETSGEYLYVDTGYQVKNTTRVELDCAFASNRLDVIGWNLFDAQNTARFQILYAYGAGLYYNAKGSGAQSFGSSAFPAPTSVKEVRRTFILDIPGLAASVVTSGFTNKTVALTGTTNYGSGGKSLKIACAYDDTWSDIISSGLSPLKIYGCKIYEDGDVIHDFVPYVKNGESGLLDKETGTLVKGKAKVGAGAGTETNLPYGGAISGENDAYIESNGSTGISTGYKMKGAISRVEVDFRFVTPARQKYIYGSSADSTIQTFLYTTGSTGVGDSFKFCQRSPTQYDTQWVCTPDIVRRVAVTDLKNKKNSLTPSPAGSNTKSFSCDFAGRTATLPLSIFGKYSSAAATAFDSSPNARIYSVRFYENYVEGGNNTPVRELIPYSRDGVVGFYDTVTGEIVKNDSAAAGAFTFGGVGTDHGDLTCYLKPGYATKVTHSGAGATLTAYAPGATSYKWFRDGQLIDDDGNGVADGADGALTVNWVRGGTKTADGYRHDYQAVAVFNLYGVERESEPTATATVTSVYLGTMLSVR